MGYIRGRARNWYYNAYTFVMDDPLEWWWRRLTASQRVLPKFLVFGAQKAGTSSLYAYLTQHPAVLAARRKEVHYFENPVHRRRGLGWYRAHFPTRQEMDEAAAKAGSPAVTGEATPCMYSYHVPRLVKEVLPDARLVFLLRDPIDRAFSHYHHNSRRGHERLSFGEAIRAENERIQDDVARVVADKWHNDWRNRTFSYIHRGLYADILEHWLTWFPRERLFIGISEEFFADPQAVLAGVTDFFGLAPLKFDTAKRHNVGSYGDRISGADREYLKERFASANERLFEMIGRRPWDGMETQ